MYEVIATKIEDAGKEIKAYWVVKAYKTHNAAQKKLLKMRQENNKEYEFNLIIR